MQGAGGGGILALSSIIVADIVALKERGTYNAFLGLYVLCIFCVSTSNMLPEDMGNCDLRRPTDWRLTGFAEQMEMALLSV